VEEGYEPLSEKDKEEHEACKSDPVLTRARY
jgi:hypothetical protein